MNRRRLIQGLAALAGGSALPLIGQDAKPLRIVVPILAGASLDTRARVIASALGERLGAQPIVENKPGAGGTIGTQFVAKAPPDGSVVLFTNSSYCINPHIYRAPGYDANKDFVPVSQAYDTAVVLVVHADVKVDSVKQLVALAKVNPDAVSYASSGVGSVPHLAMEWFNELAGIQPLHVPFKGDAQALTDLVGGRVQMMVSGIPAALPHIRSGKLRALAVSTRRRVAALPEVPTVGESGYPDYDLSVWAGFFAPAGTPKPVLEKLTREIGLALTAPTVKKHMDETGAVAVGGSSADFAALVSREMLRYGRLAKKLALAVD